MQDVRLAKYPGIASIPPAMDRFDKSFNNVDPATGRPFSRGHPDGVWIIFILYVLPLFFAFVAAVVGIVMKFYGKPFNPGLVMPLLVTGVLFGPALVLFAKRSSAAYIWMVGVTVFFAALAVAGVAYLSRSGTLTGVAMAAIFGVVLIQGYGAYYAYGLSRDKILT
jgi:hypothetical protein